MTAQTSAIAYALLALLPIAMQIAVAAGAPLGPYTVGGRFPGRLPPLWRGLALIQGALLGIMAAVVLDRGGVIATPLPPVLFWPVVGLTGLTLLANAASRSPPERRLWTPIIALMLAAALATAIL